METACFDAKVRQTLILASQVMNTMIFFLRYMEYQITLAIDRCTALMFRFLAASW